METFADTSAFNAGVKEKNTKTNKNTIVKKLATQNFLINMHIKTFPLLEYDFMKYRHRLLYYRVAPIYIRYTLYTKRKQNLHM